MGNLDKSIIVKRLALIKYLYRIGIEQSRQAGMFAGFSILTFQQACTEAGK